MQPERQAIQDILTAERAIETGIIASDDETVSSSPRGETQEPPAPQEPPLQKQRAQKKSRIYAATIGAILVAAAVVVGYYAYDAYSAEIAEQQRATAAAQRAASDARIEAQRRQDALKSAEAERESVQEKLKLAEAEAKAALLENARLKREAEDSRAKKERLKTAKKAPSDTDPMAPLPASAATVAPAPATQAAATIVVKKAQAGNLPIEMIPLAKSDAVDVTGRGVTFRNGKTYRVGDRLPSGEILTATVPERTSYVTDSRIVSIIKE